MTILKTTLVCLLGLGLTACVSESKPAEATPTAKKAPAADATKPAAKVAGLTTTALELAKVP